jgi:hypothetical protein
LIGTVARDAGLDYAPRQLFSIKLKPPTTMVSLWTWLVLVMKGKRRNLPFQNVSDNRTKIDLNLLVR